MRQEVKWHICHRLEHPLLWAFTQTRLLHPAERCATKIAVKTKLAAIAPKQFAPQAQKFNVKRDLVVKDGRFEWKYRKGNTTPTPTYKPPVTSKPVAPKSTQPKEKSHNTRHLNRQ